MKMCQHVVAYLFAVFETLQAHFHVPGRSGVA